jgi:hypothetical protein
LAILYGPIAFVPSPPAIACESPQEPVTAKQWKSLKKESTIAK